MNWKDVATGKEVTWGSGDIRGRIAVKLPATKQCGIELTHDYRTPCGKTFKRGAAVTVPSEELRYLD